MGVLRQPLRAAPATRNDKRREEERWRRSRDVETRFVDPQNSEVESRWTRTQPLVDAPHTQLCNWAGSPVVGVHV
jgi:hypothetical protein